MDKTTLLKENAKKLSKSLGIKFEDIGILENALIHRSFLNENRKLVLTSNERLEFLGDAVLELIVTDYLFRKYDNEEGELTNWRAALVRAENLTPVAKKLKIEEYILVGMGEKKNKLRSWQNILADGLEALIGAIYLDRGLPTAKKFIIKNVISTLPYIFEKQLFLDAKTALQEKAQKKWRVTPEYVVLEEGGPDHNKWFKAGAKIDGKIIGRGKGNSKQRAEKEAAQDALKKMNK